MKFAEHLSAHITPEWRKQYISYEEMKAMLYTAVEKAPSAESVVLDISIAPIESSDQTQILRMMGEEENGVLNRGKRKVGGKRQATSKEDKRALLKEETVDIDISNAS
ncbi:solute carrier family 53 member 1-like [Bombus pascuorum]|uniref:solute carrier family 53 member 1-like n=1 Tax=Bombus pascuorum TaxID=65598 RepID=UPI00298DD399|nr:solute carrier family 53 member 1-like [Bombus pascuorum]XP_060831512.1 solute carrier family 53 member 1-like [Bombus pascuorum]XP_060831600.1 solute carrier family 53 member 1-like [Bombus pascuorum]XP_060831703.1 solute carrier family 53 member 1-like [Bombus pascuorum]